MDLYRPVGLLELQRIYVSGMRAFPPRLPEQPIFYPVLNFAYAAQIAREWNTKSPPFAGYVTAFRVDDTYAAQFARRVVGARIHEELWVPAEQLAEFNGHMLGPITVGAAYFGPQFLGYVPNHSGMKGRGAAEQFAFLTAALDSSAVDFHGELMSNSEAVFLHYPFWQRRDFADAGVPPTQKARVLSEIETAWQGAFPDIALPSAQLDSPDL